MSKTRTWIGAALLASAALSGCGGGGPECGPGTSAQDGACVAPVETPTRCGPGTLLLGGRCELASDVCGAGAALDDTTGLCVANTSTVCGQGTVYDAAAGGCVAQEQVRCGTGTVARGALCVPDDALCGAGLMPSPQGCVIEALPCGEGTTLDLDTRTCEAGALACGDGAALRSGRCVATGALCDAGASFDATLGVCVGDVACQSGDVVVEGLCMRPAGTLWSAATRTSAEPDDPAQGGTPGALTLPAAGQPLVFRGEVSPSDVTQDLDVWTFQGQAGQWLELSVQPVGSLPMAWRVEGPRGFVREAAPSASGPASARQLLLPYDGAYTLTILPAATLRQGLRVSLEAALPWVASIEVVAAPGATSATLAGGPLTHASALIGARWLEITDAAAGGLLRLEAATIDGGVQGPRALVVDADGQVRELAFEAVGDAREVFLPAGTTRALLDWVRLDGDGALSLTGALTAATPEVIAAPGATLAATLTPGAVRQLRVTSPPDGLLCIAQTHAEGATLAMRVLDHGGRLASPSSTLAHDAAQCVALPGAEALVEITNPSATDAATDLVITLTTPPLTRLPALGVGGFHHRVDPTPLADGDRRHYLMPWRGEGGELVIGAQGLDAPGGVAAVTAREVRTFTGHSSTVDLEPRRGVWSTSAGDVLLISVAADAPQGLELTLDGRPPRRSIVDDNRAGPYTQPPLSDDPLTLYACVNRFFSDANIMPTTSQHEALFWGRGLLRTIPEWWQLRMFWGGSVRLDFTTEGVAQLPAGEGRFSCNKRVVSVINQTLETYWFELMRFEPVAEDGAQDNTTQPQALGARLGWFAIVGALEDDADVDLYTFELTAAADLVVHLRQREGFSGATILDASGAVVAQTTARELGTKPAHAPALPPGVYTARVQRDPGAPALTSAAPYHLLIQPR